MEETKFYHALKIDNDRCVGCTHCMTKCPTGAIRIREGKASIRKGWCVDCGECLKACPTEAIYVEQDDFQKIFDYKARVVLVPTVFIGQFSKYTTEEEIFSALYELGFTHVFQVEFTADMIHREMLRQMELAEDKPVISSFCPAIVRLIQVRFPALVDNILLVKPPVNATATYYHKVLEEDGFSSEEIGIFYVTPCAAKIASLKGAEGYSSTIKGVINMDTLYNKVYHILKSRPKNYTPECVLPPSLTKKEMRWSQTGGEAKHFSGRCLAIDEIHNVIEFLERMESTTEVRNVDFLELRACDRSCAGGVLAVQPFPDSRTGDEAFDETRQSPADLFRPVGGVVLSETTHHHSSASTQSEVAIRRKYRRSPEKDGAGAQVDVLPARHRLRGLWFAQLPGVGGRYRSPRSAVQRLRLHAA